MFSSNALFALQWGRRNYPAETFDMQTALAMRKTLQWGRRNYPAETFDMQTALAMRKTLQWGRRNYPAETLLTEEEYPYYEVASMGPPELPGGNSRGRGRAGGGSMALQWGRRNYPAETCAPSSSASKRSAAASMGPPELPGGNVVLPLDHGSAIERLQWGRRNYPAETLQAPVLLPPLHRGFNGAAGITRRKH